MLAKTTFAAAAVGIAALITLGHVPNAAAADPPPPVKAEIVVIHATKCAANTPPDKKIDARITEAPPAMAGLECMTLIEKKQVDLVNGKPDFTKLPNGRTFQLVHNGERAGAKYKVKTSISAVDGNGFTPLVDFAADMNRPFNVGGWMHLGGALMVTMKIIPSVPT